MGATRALIELYHLITYLGAADLDYATGKRDLTWAKEHVDVHLGNHIATNRMYEKLARREKEGGNPFIDENCWQDFLKRTKAEFEDMLRNEARK